MLSTSHVPGSPNWVDLGSPDVDASVAFYGALFGWQFQSAGPDAGGYGMFTLDGKTVAAVGPLMQEGAAPAWTLYFHTPDADATAKSVEQAGGTVRFAPMDVFTEGRMAGFTDPTGAEFAVWQPIENQGLEAVNDPNTLCWTELHTAAPDTAKTFYRSVFGWQTQDMPMEGFTYTVVVPAGGGEDAGQGGIMGVNDELRESGWKPGWRPYFEVADCDAAVAVAKEKGGQVVAPPADLAGVGRMAALTDPFGAPFSVITSAAAG
ncbi:VOC family protein [Streptantibioticus ferralitis]|uniref:VOC family protein n=1 Tax=Streptantibioticus ferralitis TaxID=236510 RepID=A0ABT5YTI5_9ACTN|nr:VOC family protein [Streptantibioticus ferralitis]MDF2254914.1 VOC family protein [Streptantibioticus ferralitis]